MRKELPLHLLSQFAEPKDTDSSHADDLASAVVAHLTAESALEIAERLSEWINGDMPSGASASE